MKPTLVFDFDGTLANTFMLVYEGFRFVFREQGLPEPSDQAINAMFGPTEVNCLRIALGDDKANAVAESFLAFYDQNHTRFVDVPKELLRLLLKWKSQGHKIAVFTGKGRNTFDLSCKHLFNNELFDASVTGDDVKSPKPDPEGLLKVIEQCGSRPESTLFIGDSDSDVEAGQRAGVETIRCNWLGHLPGFPKQRLNANADVATPEELDQFLESRKESANPCFS